MSHQVLARKYRPKTFDEVIGQNHVIQALTNALNRQMLHHAYLFTGTRGVGKTTIARIIAKCLNCEQAVSASPCGQCHHCQAIDQGRFPDLFEVDAASRTKVEDTRELLENVQYAPAVGRYKVYLIDEVHMLSGHSFNALLKTLEEPPEHVIFLLATTDYQKLPATILSRCLQFHLLQMPAQQIAEHLQTILQQENISFDNTAIQLLGRAANGSMRDALSLLDQSIAYGNGKVIASEVKTMLGTIEPNALYDILFALQNKDGNALLAAINQLNIQGVDFADALADLLLLLHQIAILQVIPNTSVDQDCDNLRQLATGLNAEEVQLFYQIGLIGQRDLAFAPTAQSGFEMTLLRMLAFYPETTQQAQHTAKPTAVTAGQAVLNKQLQPNNPPATEAPATVTDNSWHEILAKLKLSGVALALAQHCSLREITKTHVYLSLNAKQKPLLNPRQVQRINEALNTYLQRNIKLSIEFGEHQEQTPAEIDTQNQQNALSKAKQSIMQDENVQQLMKKFDAKLIEESINTTKT